MSTTKDLLNVYGKLIKNKDYDPFINHLIKSLAKTHTTKQLNRVIHSTTDEALASAYAKWVLERTAGL